MNKAKILLLQCYLCVASVSAAILTPALPHIEKTFALSHGSVTWIVSIFLLGYVIGQLIYGPIANRFGRLPALRAGLIINIIGIIISLMAVYIINNYFILLVGRLVTSLGAAACLACTFMLINELLDPEKAKQAMALSLIPFTVGVGLSITLAGIITQYLNWEYCFLILLLQGITMLILTWQFREPLQTPRRLHVASILCAYRKTLESKQLVKYALMVGLCSSITYGYSTAAPIYTQSILHLSASEYGYWNLLNIIGMFMSGYIGAKLMKIWSAEKIIQFSLLLMIPCLFSLIILSLSLYPNIFWFFSTTFFLYLFSGLLFSAGSFLASNAISDKASASSMMSFINMGTAMLSVMIMGYLPFSIMTSWMIVFAALFFLVLYLLFTGDKKKLETTLLVNS
jgi:DHA1 family bicyclomycin/chloramphenicol resistance-like MFS transporter